MKTMLSNLRLLLRKRNKGFTLIEMVIAVALLGILVSGIVMFMSPIMDMIKNNKKNARATMLAETINTYIMGTLSKAKVVEVFAGQSIVDAMQAGGPTRINTDYYDVLTDKATADDEIRCIAMVWREDKSPTGAGRKKLMLVNCKVGENGQILCDPSNPATTPDVDKLSSVFDDSLYSDLYTTLTVASVVKDDVDDDGNPVPVNAYAITTKVFANPSCYNTTKGLRTTEANYTSTTYVNCPGLLINDLDKTGTSYPSFVNPAIPEEDQIHASMAVWYKGDNGFTDGTHNYFYTDTLIYYLVEK